jgi:hypothetical protein
MFEVCFQYDEPSRKWEVVVKGATSSTEALQGFNAVVITASQATPKVACNRAELQADGTYKVSIGI